MVTGAVVAPAGAVAEPAVDLAAGSCNGSNVFCSWTGTNYRGTKKSYKKSSGCKRANTDTFSSAMNVSGDYVVLLYSSSSCKSSGRVKMLSTRTNMPNIGFLARSYSIG
ncbi:Peptidase inhibitor family I36 [Amycolatopsis marina]|uniref:Peptidase inhibitor family I36 n=1 Tax=Amycolatopsis marina TaxID=490629 RepID=A0A1I1BCK7_9PSEU|nr:Peptidase inhibitor family I36 [Amycolatopsis marina]